MFIVKANNILNNRSFQSIFDSEAKANEWLESHKTKQAWGRNARQVVRGVDEFDESLFLSEIDDINDGVTRVIVSLKAEYTFSGPTLIDGSGSTDEDRSLRIKNATKAANYVEKYKHAGKIIEGYFSALIAKRGLSKAQKKQIRKDPNVKSAIAELRLGALEDAIEEIKAIEIDNVLYFQADVNELEQLVQDFMA